MSKYNINHFSPFSKNEHTPVPPLVYGKDYESFRLASLAPFEKATIEVARKLWEKENESKQIYLNRRFFYKELLLLGANEICKKYK